MTVTTTECLEKVREFNMTHDVQATGDNFMLVEYLNENPDNLSVEERNALAMEFGLTINQPVEEKDDDAG